MLRVLLDTSNMFEDAISKRKAVDCWSEQNSLSLSRRKKYKAGMSPYLATQKIVLYFIIIETFD